MLVLSQKSPSSTWVGAFLQFQWRCSVSPSLFSLILLRLPLLFFDTSQGNRCGTRKGIKVWLERLIKLARCAQLYGDSVSLVLLRSWRSNSLHTYSKMLTSVGGCDVLNEKSAKDLTKSRNRDNIQYWEACKDTGAHMHCWSEQGLPSKLKMKVHMPFVLATRCLSHL